MTRLLIAEDHTAMREKVIGTLEVEYVVLAAVADGQQMLEEESRLHPDVIVLDISMPGMNGIEAATVLKQRSPGAKIIFLTVHEEPVFIDAAFAAGATGYVVKLRLVSDLCLAVREAVAGRRFISPTLNIDSCECGNQLLA